MRLMMRFAINIACFTVFLVLWCSVAVDIIDGFMVVSRVYSSTCAAMFCLWTLLGTSFIRALVYSAAEDQLTVPHWACNEDLDLLPLTLVFCIVWLVVGYAVLAITAGVVMSLLR